MNRAVLSLLISVSSIRAADAPWPQFRGPGGSGVAVNENPVLEFGPEKNLLWKHPIPSGASSPVLAAGRLFLTGFAEGKLWTLCYDATSGRELWRKEAPATAIEKFHELEGSPAASSIATDGQRVVSYFGSCGLLCYDLQGNELWRVSMPVAETDNEFGSGTSPILHDGKVFLVRDLSKDSAISCYSLTDGSEIWKAKREGFNTSYSTPAIWRHDGTTELVVGGALRLKAYDPGTGAEKWVVRNLPSVNCTTPVVAGGLLYYGGWTPGGVDAPMPEFDVILGADVDKDGKISQEESGKSFIKDFFKAVDANHDHFATREEWEKVVSFMRSGKVGIVAIKPGGKGDITDTHVLWRVDRGLPYVPTPLVADGRMYLLRDGVFFSTYDALSGKPIYTQKRMGIEGGVYASGVYAAGRIYGISLRGEAFVYSAGDEPKLLGKASLAERAVATPAVVNDVLYYRTAAHLWAFGKASR